MIRCKDQQAGNTYMWNVLRYHLVVRPRCRRMLKLYVEDIPTPGGVPVHRLIDLTDREPVRVS